MATTDLTAARARELLDYNLETGLFHWRVQASNVRKAGMLAGSTSRPGYVCIQVDGKVYKAHRLAFLLVTGQWPRDLVDHINGVASDNRWVNLRDCPKNINMQNKRKAHRNNSTGLLGVSWKKEHRKFVAAIGVDGKRVQIGLFKDAESAGAAYIEAKRRLHPGGTL